MHFSDPSLLHRPTRSATDRSRTRSLSPRSSTTTFLLSAQRPINHQLDLATGHPSTPTSYTSPTCTSKRANVALLSRLHLHLSPAQRRPPTSYITHHARCRQGPLSLLPHRVEKDIIVAKHFPACTLLDIDFSPIAITTGGAWGSALRLPLNQVLRQAILPRQGERRAGRGQVGAAHPRAGDTNLLNVGHKLIIINSFGIIHRYSWVFHEYSE